MKCKYEETCGHDVCVPQYCHDYKPKRETNGDRLRARICKMTDMEITTAFMETAPWCILAECNCECEKCLLAWLQRPAED